MKKILVLYSIIASCFFAWQPAQIKQGISGRVYLKKGNQMPSPGIKIGEGKPVQTSVWIYNLTTTQQATDNGGYFTNIQTALVTKAQSNADGYYAIALPVGKYSVFVADNGKLYANRFNGKGEINAIEVKKDSVSHLSLTISVNAVY
ncbi:hypothetical protein BDD43_1837 [Mucilaginibacter gracilis]|uniref:Carboxypeptidase family protein n=1 Tax=Mucilaginibacter gracilis TaxID=423350 RepID=A0A495IYC6_9SPHI|nr:carboxypeptidase-like regulatory domain-containing protein [Mucilaginibacter gracilis]RKR81687.1 hypothetical protein BDD43_1837 [Mucilaginibacter gracilis]